MPWQSELAAALDGLPPEQFEWAMGLALARHPGFAPPPGAPGDVAFELGGLGTVSLRQLQHFVAACARPGGPPAVWPGLHVGAGAPMRRLACRSRGLYCSCPSMSAPSL